MVTTSEDKVTQDNKKDFLKERKKIYNIFKSPTYIYKIDVVIVTDDEIIEKRIIGKKFVNGFPVRFLDIAFFQVYNNENNKTCDKKGGFSWTQVIVAVPMCRTEVVNCVCGTVDPLRPV